jgi:hypothetical protein
MMVQGDPMNDQLDHNAPQLNGKHYIVDNSTHENGADPFDAEGFEDEDDLLFEKADGLWLEDDEDEYLLTKPRRRSRPLTFPQQISRLIQQREPSPMRAHTPAWHGHPANQPLPKTASLALNASYRQMQRLALLAAEAGHPSYAAALIGAMVPLAFGQAPLVAQPLQKLLPDWTETLAQVTQMLFKQQTTRPYIAALPAIVWRAVATLAPQLVHRPLTVQMGRQALARQAAAVFSQIYAGNNQPERWDNDEYTD